jgi:glycosyltransferase involved in cell wall biosynthesis
MQFFTGPTSPGTLNPRKLMLRLAARGHDVHVVGTNHNIINDGVEVPESQILEGGGSLTVHRVPSARGMRKSLRARLRTYIGFSLRAYLYARRLPKPDLVLGSIQPLFAGLAALGIARRARSPFVLEVRDLWPDALVAKKAITNIQSAPLDAMANMLYRNAVRIASLTPGIKLELVKKGLSASRIDVFPNGFDPVSASDLDSNRERVRTEMGWNGCFVAIYTGTHVEVTSVETIVRAASRLKDRRDIRFDLFGSGQSKHKAMKLAGDLDLQNVHCHDPVPKQRIPELLDAADAGLMTLFRSPLIDIYFENKLMDYMGAGKPILGAMDGMQGRLIQRVDAGRVVPSLDDEGLARLVTDAASDIEGRRVMGENGKRFVHEFLLLSRIHDEYVRMLEQIAENPSVSLNPWEPF